MTKRLRAVWGGRQQTAVGRRAADGMTLSRERQLFKSGQATLRVVLRAAKKMYGAL